MDSKVIGGRGGGERERELALSPLYKWENWGTKIWLMALGEPQRNWELNRELPVPVWNLHQKTVLPLVQEKLGKSKGELHEKQEIAGSNP